MLECFSGWFCLTVRCLVFEGMKAENLCVEGLKAVSVCLTGVCLNVVRCFVSNGASGVEAEQVGKRDAPQEVKLEPLEA